MANSWRRRGAAFKEQAGVGNAMVTLWEGMLQLLFYICIADLSGSGGFLQQEGSTVLGRQGPGFVPCERRGSSEGPAEPCSYSHAFGNPGVPRLGNKPSLQVGKGTNKGTSLEWLGSRIHHLGIQTLPMFKH